MGSPGKVVRQVKESDLVWITRGCEAYKTKAREYAAKLVKA
jgi:carbonic anhydrase/acetyltransferase-like protein (isoleucine patch superfamily)